MQTLVQLKSLKDPQTEDSLAIQQNIFNSDSEFTQVVFGKKELTKEEIVEDNEENLQLGAHYFYIVSDKKYAGLIHYLPVNPYDGHAWIGLLIIHKKMQNRGLGAESLKLLEEIFEEKDIQKTRLSVQKKNVGGAEFWKKKGYTIINSSHDKFDNEIDIYEKEFVRSDTEEAKPPEVE